MESNAAKVVIVGGGLVGLAQGIALAQSGIPVTLVEKEPWEAQLAPQFDGRTCALSLGSMRLMRNLGVWEFMAGHAQPILDILVKDAGSPAFVHYDHAEVGEDPMGFIVENRHIRHALQQRAAQLAERLRILAPQEWVGFENAPQAVRITLKSGEVIAAALLIAADSRHSQLREAVGIESIRMDYRQTAIVATIAHEKPHQGLAMEKFFAAGPFASLPLTGNRSSLVWVEPTKTAKAMLTLDRTALEEQIQQRMDGIFGALEIEGEVFSYPLHFVLAKEYHKCRVALVGDAAHGMHPIAGQGVNLGYRDVAVMTEVLLEAAKIGQDPGSQAVLRDYSRRRQFDSAAMLGVTDGLARLFSNNNLALKLSRNLGLALVQHMQPVKRLFMQHAMGVLGDLPPLMRRTAA